METLEERRLLSTPHVLPAGPRESRPDYMTSTMDGGFPTAPEHFEWEYTNPKLVYPFDQAVAGVSNQAHSLMTLFNKVLLRHDPYPLSTSIDVDAGFGQRTTITSTDGGQSWSASLPDGYFWPVVDILLTTNGSAPNFYLTLMTVNGMGKYALTWDGYTQYTNLGRVGYTGDGNSYYFSNLGSDGYYNTPDESAQGTTIPLSNPTFNAAGDTATFALPTDLPIGNYEAILSSPGITDMGGSDHLDGDATTTEADDLHEDFVYPFFIMPGDANHDRTINIDDYGRIDSHYPATNGYINGDFNYDNIIDSSDYFIINHNFGTVLPPMPTEPNTLTVFASRDAQNVAQMTLNWNPPTDVPDIDGFGVWCSTDGTKYTYRIRAHSPSGGYSTTSNKVWAVTNLPGPGKLMVSNFTGSAVTLAWPDNAGTEDRYEVMMRVNGGDWELLDTLPGASGTGSELTYTASGIDPLAHSEFKVEAVNSAQRSSPAMWDDEAYNTRVLDLPEDRGQFSPDPTDTTYGGFFDQGVTETTAIIPAIPRHTSLQIETEYGLALDVGTESPGNQTFEIKVDGTPVYTRHYTWEQLGGGLWYNTGTTDDFHSGASKIISYANGTWPVLKVMHTASAATLTYSVDGLGPYDSWGISEVEVTATLPHIQPATYYSIAEGGQDGQFSISSDISDETLNVNVAFTGTATESVDYDTLPHEQTLPAGAPDVRTTIHAIDDQIIEGTETVTMQLLPGEGYGLLNSVLPYVPSSITAYIGDNEGGFSVTPYGGPIHEAGGALQGGFTFHRDNTSGPLDVSYTVDTSVPSAATSGQDYSPLSGSVHFDTGVGEVQVPLVPTDDSTPEWTENVTVRVSQVGAMAAELSANQEIVDEDLHISDLPEVVPVNNDDDNSDGISDNLGPISGDDDLYAVALGVPQEQKTGATVTLSAPSDRVYIWEHPDKSGRRFIGGGKNAYTWAVGQTQVPSTVYAEVIHGSDSLGDISLALAASDGPTSTSATSKPSTGIGLAAVDVAGASQAGVDKNKNPKAWVAVKKADNTVYVKAVLDSKLPEDQVPDGAIDWTGGSSVAGHKLEHTVSGANAAKTKVTARIGGKSDHADIWIIWSTLTFKMDGQTPANAAHFKQGDKLYVDGTETLGPVIYDNGTKAAGKMVAIAKLEPQGVGAVLTTGWGLHRDVWSHSFTDGTKFFFNDTWKDDTSFPEMLRLTPDDADQIYDTDAPSLTPTATMDSAEMYDNFRAYVTWGTTICSDYEPWHFKALWKKGANPAFETNEVNAGAIDLPDTAHYPPPGH